MDKYIVCYEGLGLTGSVLLRSQIAINTDINNTDAEKFLTMFNTAAINDATANDANIARFVIVSICKL
ncbi:hypothetical protein L9H26_06570 [Morganella psychrotolerans]|uniref:Uncharacterized protein n=1 Tax=Morganella psychrotolerans TaxID=368603 RepID=A0A5M9RC34_9GAMM|nr:hypothetical protein [Morganella psychrotolerans]KAA8717005.1 hypothetical protein F4V73_03790 [Morganella psychrotolerans]OBU08670.1 hypothetical protein AYY16_05240 [Morganella psychrotolerans]HCM61721.1 hypothetical protein [Morganella sp. (in: enterobacteria)]